MVKIANIANYNGQQIREAVLEDATQSIRIMSFGAATRDWRVQAQGRAVPVVLGFPKFEDYPEHSRSFGIIAGRVANRTAFGRFTLDGVAHNLTINNTPHHLHGGIGGFGKRNWELEADTSQEAIRLRYESAEGEEGYSGALSLEIIVKLQDGVLRYDMQADANQTTPVNLAQHNYYNLNGLGDVRDHQLWIAAHHYTPVDKTLIPTGEILPVAGTRLDFTKTTAVGQNDPGRAGIDLNLVLDPDRDVSGSAARLVSKETGLALNMTTNQPGLQLFNAPAMEIAVPGHDGETYGRFSGLCLEPQHFPNFLNEPSWAQSFAEPGNPYRQSLAVEIKETGD